MTTPTPTDAQLEQTSRSKQIYVREKVVEKKETYEERVITRTINTKKEGEKEV